jgi:thiol-disulfide isomerase/thioredoxin
MKFGLSIFSLFFLCMFANKSLAEQAPNFTLKTGAGQLVSLKEYKGKPLVIHFWATWCPYCKKLQPGLDKLYLKYKEQGMEMIAISFWEEDGATPQAELKSRGMHFNTLVLGEKIAKLYKVSGTPTTFFIKKNGEILWRTSDSNPNNPKLELAIKTIVEE